ncbi:solute carrier family 15 member 4 [Anaeramoeba flamelloides]|uniref:Solute carrier family 15 member 4 n=1 Tax=Anaeramoeba flamelloides TaxID=1746091 RepID=A0ABQ8Y1W3_9EUKA|nr:solute carrier family 15 member 4 [Anaeramoeba flamelloides]
MNEKKNLLNEQPTNFLEQGSSSTTSDSRSYESEPNRMPLKHDLSTNSGGDNRNKQKKKDTKTEEEKEKEKDKGEFEFPKGFYYTLATEFAERFVHYSMRAILVIFLKSEIMGYTDREAIEIYHGWIAVTYFLPLLGAAIAENWIGKYKTILYFSFWMYGFGCVLLTLCARFASKFLLYLSLSMIACGCACIKPNVSSFLSDQLKKSNEHVLNRVYSLFYMMVNVGSILSMLITPSIQKYCSFWLAFLISAVLMFSAVAVFRLGKRHYTLLPVKKGLIPKFCSVIKRAIVNRRRVKQSGKYHPKRHWLDWAKIGDLDAGEEECSSILHSSGSTNFKDSQEQINEWNGFVLDVKVFIHALQIFFPLAVFWALQHQTASTWVIQAEEMDLRIKIGKINFTISPAQVIILNPILLQIMIPIFSRIVYPYLRKRGIHFTPLQRVCFGLIWASLSFVAAGILQQKIDEANESKLYWTWQIPQYVLLVISETFVAVTGLELAISQSPKSTKSLMMSVWGVTIGLGNILVSVVEEINFFTKTRDQFFFFAALMILFFFIYIFVAYNYTYSDKYRERESTNLPVANGNNNNNFDPNSSKNMVHNGFDSLSGEYKDDDILIDYSQSEDKKL